MKKLSKKMLALILSLTLVVTMLPIVALTANAASATQTLFHYTFDTASAADNGDNLDSVNSSAAYTIDIDNNSLSGNGKGDSGYWDWFDSDHYYFTKTWARGAVNDYIRNSNYNKNWKITLDFHFFSADSSYGESGADNWNHTLGLYNNASGTPNSNPIGLQLDGRVRNGNTNLSDGTVYTFSTGKRYKVTYTYHNGIFNIFVENVTDSVASTKVFSYNCTNTDYQTILENIQGVSIGGWEHNYSSMNVFDLVATSYQDNSSVDTHLKAQYFTTKNMTKNRAGAGDLTKQGTGTTWSNSNGVTFPNGSNNHQNYFYTRTNSILSSADEVTGFTFTFQAKNTEHHWIERFFDLTDSASWASGSANGRSISLAPNLDADLVSSKYYYSDGSGGYTDSGWTDNNPSETIANFHQYAVVVQDGAIIVYVDGTAAIKCDKSIDADLINTLISNAKLYIGASMFSSDPDFVGSIKDFRIYDIALTSSQLSGLYADTLANCEAIFEKRIANMATNGYTSMYTNIAPAYECYKASKAGKGNLAGFQEALDNMQPFDEVEATGSVPTASNYAPEAAYSSNVIYSFQGTKMAQNLYTHGWSENSTAEIYGVTNGSWKYGAHAYLYYPNTVLMYDGKTTPVIPVNVGFINKDGRYSVNMLYLTENESAFGMKDSKWKGYDDSTTFKWPTSNTAVIPIDTSNTSEDSNAETIEGNTTTYRIYKNGLTYTKNPTNVYECYSSTDWKMCGQYTYIATDKQIYTDLTNNDPDIIIINYKKLVDKIKAVANDTDGSSNTNNLAAKTELGKLTSDYTEGGLEGLFIAFDSATSIDPNTGMSYTNTLTGESLSSTYDYAGENVYQNENEPMDVAAIQCRDDINMSISNLNGVKLTADHVQIKKIKEAMTAYETEMSNMRAVKTNLMDAYDAYLNAVECVDAYEYGEKTFASGELNTVYNNLVNKTAAMGTFSAKTATSQGTVKYPGDSAAISSSYYQNILYWGTPTGDYGEDHGGTWGKTWPGDAWPVKIYVPSGDQVQVDVSYPNTVIMYDGTNTPKIPVCAATYKENKNDRAVWYLYPTSAANVKTKSSYFQMAENWHGSIKSDADWGKGKAPGGSWSASWNAGYGYSGRSNITNDSSAAGWVSSNLFHAFNSGTSYYYASVGAGIMNYAGGAPSTTVGGTSYGYQKHNLTWVTHIGGSFTEGNKNDEAWGTNNTTTIYVVNYKQITDKVTALASAFSSGVNVANYREGGLTSWFTDIDSLTTFNPNSYTYSGENYTLNGTNYTGIEGAVAHCAKDIYDLTQISNVITGSTDSITTGPVYDGSGNLTPYASATSPYQKLKIALVEAKSAPPSQQCILDDVWDDFTCDSKTIAFVGDEVNVAGSKGALEWAKEMMCDVASTSYDGYGKRGDYTATQIGAIADYLHNSVAALKVPANSQHNMIFSYRDGHDVYFKCSTNNAHTLCIHSGANMSVLAADASAYDELGVIYDTIDLDKYTAAGKEQILAGKAVYDSKLTNASAKMLTADPDTNDADKTALQAYIDAGTTELLTQINTANDKEQTHDYVENFGVTFNVYTLNSKGVPSASPAYTDSTTYSAARYGSTIDLTPKMQAVYDALASGSTGITSENMGIVKWQVVADSKTRNFTHNKDHFNLFVQSDATVNVYVTKISQASQVTITNLIGNTNYVIDVTDDSTVAISKDSLNTITIDGDTYTVPNSLSYNVNGWRIGNKVVANTTTSLAETTIGDLKSTYGVTAITLSPVAVKNANADNTYDFTLDDAAIEGLTDVPYDTKITVTTEKANAYAIVIQNDEGVYVPVAYCDENVNSYTFNANQDLDFYTLCKTDEEGYYIDLNNDNAIVDGERITDFATKIYYNNKVPFMYSFNKIMGDDWGTSEGNNYSNKWTTFSAFTTNSAEITECGTLRTTESVTQDEFVLENVGKQSIVKMANTKRLWYSNQYSYSLSTSNTTPRIVVTRAYVKYRYTYGGKEIDAVAYGPMLVSYYGDVRTP